MILTFKLGVKLTHPFENSSFELNVGENVSRNQGSFYGCALFPVIDTFIRHVGG
jgi:hypothetical protein